MVHHARRMMEEYELKPLISLYYEFHLAIKGESAPSLSLNTSEVQDKSKKANPFADRISLGMRDKIQNLMKNEKNPKK